MREILITSSALIIMLFLLRFLAGRRISKRIQYALWLVVLIRLLLPISLPGMGYSILSATLPAQARIREWMADKTIYVIPLGKEKLEDYYKAEVQPGEEIELGYSLGYLVMGKDGNTYTHYYGKMTIAEVLALIWKAGMAVMILWLGGSNLRFLLWLRKNRRPYEVEGYKRRVYLVEKGMISPCLFGVFRPAVYITPEAVSSKERMHHVLLHEETHARHGDPIWAFLRGICLAIYWFDPLVWCAALASRADCELACDEGVLRQIGEKEHIAYGKTLLALIPVTGKAGNPLVCSTMMTADKRRIKERITRIAEKPRNAVAALTAVVVLAVLAGVLTFTGAQDYKRIALGKEGSVSREVSVPDEVLQAAAVFVQGQYEAIQGASQVTYPESYLGPREEPEPPEYDDWRILSLEGPFLEKADDMTIEIYRCNYEFHTTTPERVILAGGSYMTEDNWVCIGYPDSTYFCFREENGSMDYLFTLMENDCLPGDETFREDMIRRLEETGLAARAKSRAEMEKKWKTVAKSPEKYYHEKKAVYF